MLWILYLLAVWFLRGFTIGNYSNNFITNLTHRKYILYTLKICLSCLTYIRDIYAYIYIWIYTLILGIFYCIRFPYYETDLNFSCLSPYSYPLSSHSPHLILSFLGRSSVPPAPYSVPNLHSSTDCSLHIIDLIANIHHISECTP